MVVRSNALKGYIYRQKGTPNPLGTRWRADNQLLEPTDEMIFRYYPELGKKTDPHAYMNSVGQDLVDLMRIYSDSPNASEVKEFEIRKHRNQESMIRFFTDNTYFIELYAIPEGIMSNMWENMPLFKWKTIYLKNGKQEPPTYKHQFLDYAEGYADWKNDRFYGASIIDDPKTKKNDTKIHWVESKKDIPKGKVYKNYPPDYYDDVKEQLEQVMQEEISKAATNSIQKNKPKGKTVKSKPIKSQRSSKKR